MSNRIIADRYARALLHSCPDLPTIERAQNEIDLLGRTYEQSSETRHFLLNPKIPEAIKRKILGDALSPKFASQVISLLYLLLEKRRQNLIPEIADRYRELTDKIRGVEKAEIRLALEVTPDLRKKLLDTIQRFSSRNVEVNFITDPSIIGGVVIRIGDTVIDGSLKRRFEDIRRTMLAAQLPMSAQQE